MQTALRHCLLLVALLGGCTGGGRAAHAGLVTTPDAMASRPGVRAVFANLDEPIYYNGIDYWKYAGGFWYRSISHAHGWQRVEDAPVEIRTMERRAVYLHYQGEALASLQAPGPQCDPGCLTRHFATEQ